MRASFYNLILMIVFFGCMVLFFMGNLSVHANATEGSTPSNVTVQKSLAIDFSENLSDGIKFGTVNLLPATNINASHNYDGLDDESTFFVMVSNDSNSNVDLCIKANSGLMSSGGDVLGLGNETFSNYSLTNISFPSLADQVSLSTNYSRAGSDINVGTNNYYRFWLDIPGGQPSGDYNNTIFFKGMQAGNEC